jgi:Skp family chaperone for outer membrane proteins
MIPGLLAIGVLATGLAMAQAPAAPPQAPAAQPQAAPATPAVIGPAKIAWLNLEQAILSCEEGKLQFAEVQRFVDKKNQELEALRKETDALKNQLQVQGSKLTDEARDDLESQIEAKDTLLQRFQQDTQKEIDGRRIRVTNLIGRKLVQVLDKLAKEKGLTAILYFNPQRDAWMDTSLFITEEVVKAYNQAYPPAAAAKPAPAKKP